MKNSIEQNEITGFWQNINAAMRGIEIDYTTVQLNKAILFLALPMVLEMTMESVFVLVDVFWVAKRGAEAVAVVGLTDSVVTLVYAVAVGLTMAVSAMVSRRIGEHAPEKAAHAAIQSIYISIAISIPLAVAGIFYAKDILSLMGASDNAIAAGSGYTAMLLGGNITIMLIFVINAIFRGSGDAIYAMRSLWLANSINLILDPCLIFGLGPFPEYGVAGAGMATTIGRGVGVLYQLWILFGGRTRIKIHRNHLKINLKLIKGLLRVSFGGILQYLIATASWIGVIRILAIFGDLVIAGYTIAIRIISFTFLPSWGIANAASTLVGQNLGANNADRAEKAVWHLAMINFIFLGTISIILVLIPQFFIRQFTDDGSIIPHAVECLRYVACCYPFLAYGMVMAHAFNGAGDTYTPSAINFVSYWLFQIPAAYLVAVQLELDSTGIFIVMAAAEVLIALIAVPMFRRGRWKLQKI
ncbi:MATE family efflux transporter [candidate division KSB1 bacterium]|nr:MATE family efflux transporter [candidate division KSB1 bacterium]